MFHMPAFFTQRHNWYQNKPWEESTLQYVVTEPIFTYKKDYTSTSIVLISKKNGTLSFQEKQRILKKR